MAKIIGIDPGVNTGFAIWDCEIQKFMIIESIKIHQAMDMIKNIKSNSSGFLKKVFVEDARKRTWFGNAGREQLQGAGSIKRDCGIWESFLTDHEIPFELIPPKANKTKLNALQFKQITGWMERTNEHSRDAAMLVFQR